MKHCLFFFLLVINKMNYVSSQKTALEDLQALKYISQVNVFQVKQNNVKIIL